MGSKSYSTVTTDASYSSADIFSAQSDTTTKDSYNTSTSVNVTESKELASALAQSSQSFAQIAMNATAGLQAFASNALSTSVSQSTEQLSLEKSKTEAATTATKTAGSAVLLVVAVLAGLYFWKGK